MKFKKEKTYSEKEVRFLFDKFNKDASVMLEIDEYKERKLLTNSSLRAWLDYNVDKETLRNHILLELIKMRAKSKEA